MAKYPMIKARSYSYGGKRSVDKVKYIVIHYTGNKGDTAKGNCNYFKNGNTRYAGAHFFVDQYGNTIQSVPMGLTAWSVGGFFTQAGGAGKYYQRCLNSNSVSIELCDCATKDPSTKMIKAVKALIGHIQDTCPNAKTIIRHWDVNGKQCPARMSGKDNDKWDTFKKAIVGEEAAKTVAAPKVKSKAKKKSTTEIAREVINGKWGNGETRRQKLKSAGYDPDKVQKKVNALLK